MIYTCLQVKVKDNNSNEPWALALRCIKRCKGHSKCDWILGARLCHTGRQLGGALRHQSVG